MSYDFASAFADAAPEPYWLDSSDAPRPCGRLVGDVRTDLVVVGGGFSGLWTALLAKERDPVRDVVLVEAKEVAWAASGRNGGMISSSLTHGIPQGARTVPDELSRLESLGIRNLDAMEDAINRYSIDCQFERKGKITIATRPHEVGALHRLVELAAQHGRKMTFLDREEMRSKVDSPTYLGGVEDRDGYAIVNPARLAWGLKQTCLDLGVRIFENTPARALDKSSAGVLIKTPHGSVDARRAALATNVFPSLLRRIRLFTVPVYDYAMMTEPLSAAQMESIGWKGRQGLADMGSQFHYYRLTADNRILWGGYDVIYPYGSKIHPARDQRADTFSSLSQQFFETFPQLQGLRFTHTWGGAIDFCSRFYAFYGTAMNGQVAYSVGYAGLGVAATRFGAEVVLDLLSGERTDLTSLEVVKSRPLPFPPEPIRWAGIEITRRSMQSADNNGGRQNVWLRALDTVGIGLA